MADEHAPTYPKPAAGLDTGTGTTEVVIFIFDQYGPGATVPDPPAGTVVEHLPDGSTVHRTPDDWQVGRDERRAQLWAAGLAVDSFACDEGCCLVVTDPELRPPPLTAGVFAGELLGGVSTYARRAMFDVLDDDSANPFVEGSDLVMRVRSTDWHDPLYRPL